jgi:predicted DNA-binding transcriptional regulator AlpA
MGKRNASPVMRERPAVAVGKRFLNETEVEALSGISAKTLANWRILGRGPRFTKFGSAVRYDVNALEEWIDSLPTGGAGVPASALK